MQLSKEGSPCIRGPLGSMGGPKPEAWGVTWTGVFQLGGTTQSLHHVTDHAVGLRYALSCRRIDVAAEADACSTFWRVEQAVGRTLLGRMIERNGDYPDDRKDWVAG